MDSKAQDAADEAVAMAMGDLEAFGGRIEDGAEEGRNVALAICLAGRAICCALLAEGIRLAEAFSDGPR